MTFKGLTENTIRSISHTRGEPDVILKWRLDSFALWQRQREPHWAVIDYNPLSYDDILYYAVSGLDKKATDHGNMDQNLLDQYQQLGVPLHEYSKLANVAADIVIDSESVFMTAQESLKEHGIIFCSMQDAIKNHLDLVERYMGTVVGQSDNFFASLNSSVFSDGSFIYIPPYVKCPVEISTYFRLNMPNLGQFERTLIIADKYSYVSYLEGCTAPIRKNRQLHCAVVELVAMEGATIRYSTMQNWYRGEKGGGVYNFVTKRGCAYDGACITWSQVEIGSALTWKYPSVILKGDHSVGKFFSLAIGKGDQQADTGTKMIHVGSGTKSQVVAKSILSGYAHNTHRSLLKVVDHAIDSLHTSCCDSLLVSDMAVSNAIPKFLDHSSTCQIHHEATVSFLRPEQLSYLHNRRLSTRDATSLILCGFSDDIFSNLPLEFALEAKHLINTHTDNL